MEPTKKQKINIQNDNELLNQLQKISTVVEAHDQVIFQSIIGINVLQKILIDKNIITIEELQSIAETEASSFKEKVEKIIKKNRRIHNTTTKGNPIDKWKKYLDEFEIDSLVNFKNEHESDIEFVIEKFK